jgi:hypothetical protein
MACCTGADHACSQARADDCCAAGEQRQHGETAAIGIQSLAAPLLIVAPDYVPLVTAGHTPAPPYSHTGIGAPPDTHILLSVFRI